MAAGLLDAPMAFVSVIARDTAVLVGRHGTEIDAVARQDSFCSHAILGDDPLVIPDTAADARFAENPLARDGMAFYAGAPLISPAGGHRLGALCVTDTVPRPPLDDHGRALLVELARLVVVELERRRDTTLAA